VDQLLIALDVESAAKALALADSLRGVAGGFKIGSQLFTSQGPTVVRALAERGDRIFLDLKFHDIPNTVAGAVAAATSLGVWMLNVHASGGTRMMQAARDAARETASRAGGAPPLVIAVTVLTSINAAALAEIGVGREMPDSMDALRDHVVRLAQLADAAGLDGVVASPQETAVIRRRCRPDFAIVTPGIRGGGAASAVKDDQERTMGPAAAVAAGASYIVVGRPITAAADPRAAAEAIAAEIRTAGSATSQTRTGS
jgi:orotidine-5'-phosphate decarboxylase